MNFNPATDLLMYGESDDLMEFDGVHRGEVGCYDRPVRVTLTAPSGEGMIVTWTYAADEDGGWSPRIAILEEDIRIPWRLSISDGRGAVGSRHAESEGGGYSVALIVHDCVGSTITCLVGKDEVEVR